MEIPWFKQTLKIASIRNKKAGLQAKNNVKENRIRINQCAKNMKPIEFLKFISKSFPHKVKM